jgi:hypothetical protein
MHLARLHRPLVVQQLPRLRLPLGSLRHQQLPLVRPVGLVLLQLLAVVHLAALVAHLVGLLPKHLAVQASLPLQVVGVAASMHLVPWQQLVAAAQGLGVVGLGAAQGLAHQGPSRRRSSSSRRASKAACGR